MDEGDEEKREIRMIDLTYYIEGKLRNKNHSMARICLNVLERIAKEDSVGVKEARDLEMRRGGPLATLREGEEEGEGDAVEVKRGMSDGNRREQT